MKRKIIFFVIFFVFLNLAFYSNVKGLNEFYVINTNPSGEGSFLWAIKSALNSGGIIKFNIPKEDENFNGKFWLIKPRENIPIIDKKIIIDGLSQTERFGNLNPDGPEIIIDGSYITSDSFFVFKYDKFEFSGIDLKNFKNTDYIRVESDNGLIKEISIEGGQNGIHLFKANGVKIESSIFKNLNIGIYLYYSNYNSVSDSFFEKGDIGVKFYYSSKDEIRNSKFKNLETGVRIFYSSNLNRIFGNLFESNQDGIFLRDTFYQKNEIFENRFLDNINGIHLMYGTASLIYDNEFNENNNGVYLEKNSNNNNIESNNFIKNDYGVKFFYSSDNNLLIKNDFKENLFGIYFLDSSSSKNRFSKNIMIKNKTNIFLNNGNNGVENPEPLFSKILGKSIILSIKSEKVGKVEFFKSDSEGLNCEEFFGEKEINFGINNFYIVSDYDLMDKTFLFNFTDSEGNTSDFRKITLKERVQFLDLTLKGEDEIAPGSRAEFTSQINNLGDEDALNVKFRVKIPIQFKEIEVNQILKGASYFIQNNEIFVDNIFINKKSNVLIKFSFLVPNNTEIDKKFSIQGEVEYYPLNGLKIVEKSDGDGVDDGIPNSFSGDEETIFIVTGKPIISIDLPNTINVNSKDYFEIPIEIENIGTYQEKNLTLKIFLPDSVDFVNSNLGVFKKDEGIFYLNILQLKENEKVGLIVSLKAKESVEDKSSKIILSLFSESNNEIKREINLFIKGEGKEALSLRVEAQEEVNLYSNFSVVVFVKNSGTKEARDKKLFIKIPKNVQIISDSFSKDLIQINIDRIGLNEELKYEFNFRLTSGCNETVHFEFILDNFELKKDIKVKCLKIYHHPIISGYPDGTFKPDNFIKRVEVAVILSNTFLLSRVSNINLPKDVRENFWGKDFILNVITNGLMSGYPDGTFLGDKILKRSEAAAIIFNILGLTPDYGNYFKDIDDNYWAKGIIGAVYKKGVISGYSDNTFRGEKEITRSEFLVMLLKAIGRGDIRLGEIKKFKDLNENHWAYNYILEATTPHILINPEKLTELKIKDKEYPIFVEKQNSYIIIPKIGEKISVSIPFIYKDLREIEIEVVDVGVKLP